MHLLIQECIDAVLVEIRGKPDAIIKAKRVFEKLKEACKNRGPLHGIKVSLSDDETMGEVRFWYDTHSPFLWFDDRRCTVNDLILRTNEVGTDLQAIFSRKQKNRGKKASVLKTIPNSG